MADQRGRASLPQLYKFENGKPMTPEEAGMSTNACRHLEKKGYLCLVEVLSSKEAHLRAPNTIRIRRRSRLTVTLGFCEVYQLTDAGRKQLTVL